MMHPVLTQWTAEILQSEYRKEAELYRLEKRARTGGQKRLLNGALWRNLFRFGRIKIRHSAKIEAPGI